MMDSVRQLPFLLFLALGRSANDTACMVRYGLEYGTEGSWKEMHGKDIFEVILLLTITRLPVEFITYIDCRLAPSYQVKYQETSTRSQFYIHIISVFTCNISTSLSASSALTPTYSVVPQHAPWPPL